MKRICMVLIVFVTIAVLMLCACGGNHRAQEKEEETASAALDLDAELQISADPGELLYLRDVYSGETALAPGDPAERLSLKEENLQAYISLIGSEPEEEITADENGNPGAVYDNGRIEAGTNYICVSDPDFVLKSDSSDEEVVSLIKNNACLFALAKMTGLDMENVYIHREELTGRKEDGEISYRKTDFRVCSRAGDPALQAFELQFGCIYFWIMEDFEDEAGGNNEIRFYGYFMQEEKIGRVSEVVSYAAAKEEAGAQIASAGEAAAILGCRIVYDGQIKNGFFVPSYRFFYQTPDGAAYVDVACCDPDTLR